MKKIKVYSVWCDHTDRSGIQANNLQMVADIIEGDITTFPESELKEVEYKIKIQLMTQEEYDALPEYEY